MLRAFLFSLLSLAISLLFQAVALANTPICVRSKEATARPSKPVRLTASTTKVETLSFDKYTPFSWTGIREGKWMEVQTKNGRTHWLRARDLTTSIRCLEVSVQKSQLYQGPGRNFKPAELAEKGDVFLDLGGGEDGWIQIQDAQGKRAWINLDHVWKPTSTLRMSFSPE